MWAAASCTVQGCSESKRRCVLRVGFPSEAAGLRWEGEQGRFFQAMCETVLPSSSPFYFYFYLIKYTGENVSLFADNDTSKALSPKGLAPWAAGSVSSGAGHGPQLQKIVSTQILTSCIRDPIFLPGSLTSRRDETCGDMDGQKAR